MSPVSPTQNGFETVKTTKDRKVLARSKWLILASAISRKRCPSQSVKNEESLLRFPSFEVIEAKQVSRSKKKDEKLIWFNLSLPEFSLSNLKICIIPPSSFTLHDLTGFNNTGNLCIWPAEECLAQFCLENRQIFEGKSVIELGGGMTCMAGLAIALGGRPREVVLTDGNETSAINLENICQANSSLTTVRSSMLRWNDVSDVFVGKFDVAISSDCLFFDEGRPQLLNCLKKILVPGGLAIIVAPSRHGTFEKFERLCRLETNSFHVEHLDNYSDKIFGVRRKLSNDSRFDENLQYPKLLKLRKLTIDDKR